jgi:hypothetical protein
MFPCSALGCKKTKVVCGTDLLSSFEDIIKYTMKVVYIFHFMEGIFWITSTKYLHFKDKKGD